MLLGSDPEKQMEYQQKMVDSLSARVSEEDLKTLCHEASDFKKDAGPNAKNDVPSALTNIAKSLSDNEFITYIRSGSFEDVSPVKLTPREMEALRGGRSTGAIWFWLTFGTAGIGCLLTWAVDCSVGGDDCRTGGKATVGKK